MSVGSVPLAQRAAGPDLARGAALLGIALANTVGWLHGDRWTVLLKQTHASAADRTVDVLVALLADNRGFPLFALLFGYGIGIMHRRSLAAGERPGRFALRMLRRFTVLGAIGMLHAVLLFSGDILVSYAVIGTACALLAARGRLALLLAAMVCLAPLGLWGWVDATIALGGGDGYVTAAAGSWGEGVTLRAHEALRSLAFAPVEQIGLLAPMALGAAAASLRMLELPRENADLLRPLARWGLLVGLVGAVPLTAVLVLDPGQEVLGDEVVLGILGVLHQGSGLAGAVGAAALCALLADRWGRGGRSRALTALTALGATALSAYVAQSLVASLLFPPYTFDLGARLGSAGASAIMALTWLVTLLAAAAWHRTGRRGPLEAVLRRLAGSAAPAGARRSAEASSVGPR